jgi:hypothetical protein
VVFDFPINNNRDVNGTNDGFCYFLRNVGCGNTICKRNVGPQTDYPVAGDKEKGETGGMAPPKASHHLSTINLSTFGA